jgi:hypothetical protein
MSDRVHVSPRAAGFIVRRPDVTVMNGEARTSNIEGMNK